MLFTWKQKCKKAASFLYNYNWEYRRHEENRQHDVRTVTETVAKILKIQIPENITPQETSFCVLDLITEFEYKQSQEVLFPSWLRRTREEQLAFIERDYGKFYEAVYKVDSDEQRCRVQIVEILSLYRFEGIEKFEVSDFFEYLRRYLRCFKDVKKDEMRLFLEKSLSALWGIYLEGQEDISKNQDNKPGEKTAKQKEFENIIGFAKNAFHFSVTRANCPDNDNNKVYDFIRMLTDKINADPNKQRHYGITCVSESDVLCMEEKDRIIDWSPLYTYIKFDGENYIFTGYGEEEELHEVIGKAPCFELGCIFEIGRILHKNGIRFHGITIAPQDPQTEGKRKNR